MTRAGRMQERRPSLVPGPVIAMIDNCLQEDQNRPTKQHHTARHNYERLAQEIPLREKSSRS